MPQVTSKCSLEFMRDSRVSGSEKFNLGRTAPGEYKDVPDWVTENAYFQAAISDGRVTLVEVKSKPTRPMPSNHPAEIEKLKMVLQPSATGNEGGLIVPANSQAAVAPVPVTATTAPDAPAGTPPLARERVRKNMVAAK